MAVSNANSTHSVALFMLRSLCYDVGKLANILWIQSFNSKRFFLSSDDKNHNNAPDIEWRGEKKALSLIELPSYPSEQLRRKEAKKDKV